RGAGKAGLGGLVAAHLLGCYDGVEVGATMAARDAEQLVVDVGHDADLVASREPIHRRVRLAKRLPAPDAVGQELSAGRLELPADRLAHLRTGPPQAPGG